MIEIRGLYARAGSVEILKCLDLSIESGEFVALAGPNGAGKTTLLRHLNGLRKPDAGIVTVDGMDTRRVRTSRFARTVGFLFQNPDHQILCGSVAEEIRFGLKHTGVPKAEWPDRILKAAGTMGLAEMLDADPFELSRPLRQRLALASVLALRPKVLVLDEPTSSQDERGALLVLETARALNESGVTVILVSHDMELVAGYARRVVVLVDGRIAADRKVHDLFQDDRLLSSSGLTKPGAYRMAAALGIVPESGRPLTSEAVADALAVRIAGACA